MSNPIHVAAHVSELAELGSHVRVDPFAVVHPFTTIGSKCQIHSGAVIGDLPQDLKFDPSTRSYVRIGEHTVMREGVTIHRGTAPESETRVGSHCFLMVNSHVGHNCQVGDHVILANGVLLAGHVTVEDRAFISGNAVVHQFCRIGKLAMISGLSAINKDVPPFCVTHSATTCEISGINTIGLRRAGYSSEERTEIKHAFKLLFMSKLSPKHAVGEIQRAFSSGPALEMAQFVAESSRGIGRYHGNVG